MAERRKATSIVVWVLVGMLVVGLFGFGTTDFGGGSQAVARVGDREVDANDYARALQQELRVLAAQSGRPFSIAEAQALGVDRQVLTRLLGQAALDAATEAAGLSVGDVAVAEQISTIEGFQKPGGGFDRDAYAFTLRNTGLTVSDFEERVRQDTARNLTIRAISGAAAATPAFVDALYAWARERRDVSWLALGPGDLAEPVAEPTEADLAAWYATRQDSFATPETKAITYAWLTPEMMLDEIGVSEEDLQVAYDARRADFVQPARRLVERLPFRSAEDAAAAKARLDAGTATFDALVEERGLTLADIDQGIVSEADLGEAAPEVFALEGPGIAGPLPSPLGPALYRVNALLDATETPLADVADELRAEIAADRGIRAIDELRAELDDQLAGGATLEELAQDSPMELGTIDWTGAEEEGIAAYEGFREAADAALEGDYPELGAFAAGGLFALRVDAVRPPAPQPLEAVREQVAAAVRAERTRAALLAQAEARAADLRGGAPLPDLRAAPRLLRDGTLDGGPEDAVRTVFQMAPGEVRTLASEDGAVLLRLDAVTPPAEDDEARTAKAAFSEGVAQSISEDALELFIRAIQVRDGVEIYDQAVAAVAARMN